MKLAERARMIVLLVGSWIFLRRLLNVKQIKEHLRARARGASDRIDSDNLWSIWIPASRVLATPSDGRSRRPDLDSSIMLFNLRPSLRPLQRLPKRPT